MTLVVGSRGRRAALVCALASALAPVAIVPHVVEDVVLDGFGILDLGPLGAGLLVGVVLAIQLLGALGAVRDHRLGYVTVLVVAALWIVIALVDHPDAFVGDDFRAGFPSRIAVWGIVGIQALAAVAALSALRATRRGSFTGTGTVTKGGP
jgi:hypothetical protein